MASCKGSKSKHWRLYLVAICSTHDNNGISQKDPLDLTLLNLHVLLGVEGVLITEGDEDTGINSNKRYYQKSFLVCSDYHKTWDTKYKLF